MSTKEEPDGYAVGEGESGYQYDTNASYYGQQVSYPKTEPGAVGGNGTTAEQSSYDADQSGTENQSFEVDSATQELVEELKAESTKLDPVANKHALRLLKAEIERLTTFSEPEYLEVDIPKPIRIVRKVMVPVNRNPKFNFVGKLLGPGGKTLQSLIHSTRCRIYILGRGSSREKAKEEELLASGDQKYAHLKDPLYVRVEASGPAAVAYQKIAHVLNELQYYLQPVKDDIYMQQMADMGKHVGPPPSGPPTRGGIRGSLMGAAPPMRGAAAPRGSPRGGGGATRGRGFLIQTPPGPGPVASRPPPPSAPPSGPPPNYVTYPGYDYGNYGEYQQSAPPPPQPAQHYGNVQAPPPPGPPGPPVPPIPPPVGVPPGPPSGPPPPGPPPSSGYGANSYSYPYGYDYSQYNHSNMGTQGPPPPRPPGPMPPGGGGKAPPPMGRGRGMPRPAPY